MMVLPSVDAEAEEAVVAAVQLVALEQAVAADQDLEAALLIANLALPSLRSFNESARRLSEKAWRCSLRPLHRIASFNLKHPLSQ